MTKLNISRMTCGHPQQAVISALEFVDGVQRANVDFAGGTAEGEGNAPRSALIVAVEDEGYRTTLSER